MTHTNVQECAIAEHMETRAFLFDSYNYYQGVASHTSILRELVVEIAANSIGADAETWIDSYLDQEMGQTSGNELSNNENIVEIDLSKALGLPTSFSCRGERKRRQKNNVSTSSRRKKMRRKREEERRNQFTFANRRRSCCCVPVSKIGVPGVSPCGRKGQQCGCYRPALNASSEMVGTVWEAWRTETGWWQWAVVTEIYGRVPSLGSSCGIKEVAQTSATDKHQLPDSQLYVSFTKEHDSNNPTEMAAVQSSNMTQAQGWVQVHFIETDQAQSYGQDVATVPGNILAILPTIIINERMNE